MKDKRYSSHRNEDAGTLLAEIKRFRKSRWFWAAGLLIVALFGLIIPIIPGILILIIILALFKKGWMEKIRHRFRLWKIYNEE
ncbi:MAG: hypothetical protein JXR46_08825 [Calditrichaceae bacterium]|nr:hypothetical protein [Calditrichaceae bacterium]MBN2709135.1 hypothetical protein [Calditrichaceae bacterium]RQV96091.1 MAG: hypothetical protein EH224_05135 [Calditrichota bacterium]